MTERIRTVLVRGVAIVVVLAAISAALSGGAANATSTQRGLTLGFNDDGVIALPNQADVATAMGHARTAGASVWRVQLNWSTVAPTAPPSLAAASDPGWSGYRWASIDQTVRQIAAAGMTPMIALQRAPRWAEGAGRPSLSVAPAGTWKPSPTWLGAFAHALAARYTGTYVDAAESPQPLPAVRDWEAWNEPNLTVFLSPQWTRSGSTYKAASPALYRAMLNAVYHAIHAAAPTDVVAAGATAPFGDPIGSLRMQPAYFWRALLCLTAGPHTTSTHCAQHVYFDAVSHHPYPIGPPNRHALNADDVVVPDLGRITTLIPVAQRAGTVLPRGPKPLWITEISWDSFPDPQGLSLAQQAQYLEGSLYVLWKEGASLIAWWKVRDDAPIPNYAVTYQSGVFLRGATPALDVPKPSYTAFRFPFTAYRSHGVAALWGISPTVGPVTVQVLEGSRWVDGASLIAGQSRIFAGSLVVGPGTQLRAVASAYTSLVWTAS